MSKLHSLSKYFPHEIQFAAQMLWITSGEASCLPTWNSPPFPQLPVFFCRSDFRVCMCMCMCVKLFPKHEVSTPPPRPQLPVSFWKRKV